MSCYLSRAPLSLNPPTSPLKTSICPVIGHRSQCDHTPKRPRCLYTPTYIPVYATPPHTFTYLCPSLPPTASPPSLTPSLPLPLSLNLRFDFIILQRVAIFVQTWLHQHSLAINRKRAPPCRVPTFIVHANVNSSTEKQTTPFVYYFVAVIAIVLNIAIGLFPNLIMNLLAV